MHFQIFVPASVAATQPAAHPLEVAGLADFVGGAVHVGVDVGPGDQRGTCYAWSRSGFPRIVYQPDTQKWRAAVPCGDQPAGRYWVGVWKDSPILPEEIQRPYACRGTLIGMGDGKQWLIPHARELPAKAILDDDGTWKFQVQRQYHEFWLESLQWLRYFGTGNISFDFGRGIEFVTKALRVNYRILPELIDELGLLTQDNISAVMLSIVEGFAEAIG